MKTRENERRDSGIIIILILLLGFICIILASGWALRFAPSWRLNTDMGSNLNPNSDFLTSRPVSFIEPLDPAILTNPVWMNVFLTPGASFETRTPVPTAIFTNIPPKTSTPVPTLIAPATNTLAVIVIPTNTKINVPPLPATATPNPPPTNTPVPPPPSANLQITKTDGVATIITGGTTIYTVRVTNNGPSSVTGAILSDVAAAGLSKTTVGCSTTPGQCVTAPTAAQLEAGTFTLPALTSGQFYEITITANVTALSGSVTNTATVATPVGTNDPLPANNTASDTDTVTPVADLAITKTDVSLTYTPGNPITYTIVVTNAGPSDAIGASVADTIPASIAGTTINCVASGTASCGTNASVGNNLSFTGVSIPAGAGNFLTITVSGTVNLATTGNLVNSATVTAGAGQTDPTPGNNTATDTNTQFVPPSADLQITKDDFVATYTPGGTPLTYTITVTNNGPDAVIGATVTDLFPAQITSANWTCSSVTGGTCTASGSGNINDLVNLPVSSTITYTVTANTSANAVGTIKNDATVSIPAGVTETNAGNNTATDSDTSTSTEPNIGLPDGSYYNPGQNGSITFVFSPAIIANNDSTPDFVYYEILFSATQIAMDWVKIEISSDGSTWIPVFIWGDGIADTNSNVNINDPAFGGTEADNRTIDIVNLYNGNTPGITVDIDAIPGVTPGSYPWMRISGIGGANGPDVDAIQPITP